MPAPTPKLPDGPGLYGLLFVLGDIFMIPTHGPNLFSAILILLALIGAGIYFWRNLPRLRR